MPLESLQCKITLQIQEALQLFGYLPTRNALRIQEMQSLAGAIKLI